MTISKDNINFSEDLEVNFSITNTGDKDGKEITQLYIQDIVGSITRPIKELKRFKHVFLKKGETKEVSFKISSKDLEFVNDKIVKAAEEGKFNLWVGPNAVQGLKKSFSLKK
jgi:beta-glucosidase